MLLWHSKCMEAEVDVEEVVAVDDTKRYKCNINNNSNNIIIYIFVLS